MRAGVADTGGAYKVEIRVGVLKLIRVIPAGEQIVRGGAKRLAGQEDAEVDIGRACRTRFNACTLRARVCILCQRINFRGHRETQRVPLQRQVLEVRELADLRRDVRCQRIESEGECREPGDLADRRRDWATELVIIELEMIELRKLADRRRDRAI
eukprot:CAMPEP_0180079878 /NCGR_PEP_ID=MMETSP0985-20121206/17185_1 /TAXON_ID=483367 /ORGANISM="non described non described, Strain CCMP 2436" /LENGTH=155 /DNA_ID=CAMNT_0022012747 /DNA_START=1 /DNA_END=469 /DNA_ORIENTATION=-